MPELLLEILSEEIPARMQGQAARDLERSARERLAEAGLTPETLTTYAGPRRLTLHATGLPAAQEDRVEERKGPRANAPEQAVDGFLRSTGLGRDQLQERDGVLFASIARPGRPTPAVVAEMVEAVVRGFPWPKSMRWGAGTLRWVRPIKRILCTFDGEVVPLEIEGLAAGDTTEGHRFMGAAKPFRAGGFDAYASGLRAAFVMLDAAERRARIVEGARRVCGERGLALVEDEALLQEVSGLAEWPTPILGRMDPSFLDLPPEVIRTSMRAHQKYFAVAEPETGRLAPHFVAVANIEASDGGAAMAEGYARVLSARLNDARFFWDEDRKVGLEARLEKLKGVTFHAKLGTMAARVERITALARDLAPLVGADPNLAERAGRLCKADLATGMVGEFPELQGIMGGYYARMEPYAHAPAVDVRAAREDAAEEDPLAEVELLADAAPMAATRGWFAGLHRDDVEAVANAVRDHYRPQGPHDETPTAPVSVAVALADKLDTLVGFFAADEKPTGSRDPYGLRRAALGVLRILIETGRDFALDDVLRRHALRFGLDKERADQLATELGHGFMGDRLFVMLRDAGSEADYVKAALAKGAGGFRPCRGARLVEAFVSFLRTEDGANLLAGYRRAVNIVRAEAAKTGERYDGGAIGMSGAPPEERALMDALSNMREQFDRQLAAEDFGGAMQTLATLRAPVDLFFDKVLVNDPDPAVRRNRLQLLAEVRRAMNRVADFSLIAG